METPMATAANILLVEDNYSFQDICRTLFEEKGYSVTTAADGKEAWDRYQLSPDHFRCIITDHKMPAMTGGELTSLVRKKGFKIPIVIMSGNLSELDSAISRLDNVQLLSKPFCIAEVDKILSTINEVC